MFDEENLSHAALPKGAKHLVFSNFGDIHEIALSRGRQRQGQSFIAVPVPLNGRQTLSAGAESQPTTTVGSGTRRRQ